MKKFSLLVSLALVSFLAGVGLTYVATSTVWVSDMANQQSIKPQEMPFAPPAGAVPVGPVRMQLATHEEKAAPGGAKREPVSPSGGHHGGASPAGADHHGGASPGPADHHGSAAPSGDAHHGGASPANPGHHGGTSPAPDDHHGGTSPAGPGHHGAASPAPQDHHGGASPSPQGDHGGHGDAHGMAMGNGLRMANATQPTSASIQQGESLFAIYCSVCHGAKGQGGMPIAEKFPRIPRFTSSLLRQTPDSHMFSMLTSGHGPMPGYAEALSSSERWDVINYLRELENEL